jgi:polyphenol oxidase
MPVLAADAHRILAVHSGWRGTLLNIIGQSLQQVFSGSSTPVNVHIGPFIQASSFEVGLDVAQKFAQMDPQLLLPHPTEPKQKSMIQLARAAQAQIQAASKNLGMVSISATDTMTDANYASYRRDRPEATRNISFVARL